ncbi:MAG: LUD domain-containing protein [Deferribacterota bacterium]|nr:LUD domain-containing protein [Deferribacterota bacterium]
MIDLFLKYSIVAGNENEVVNERDFNLYKRNLIDEFDFVYVPYFELFKKVDINEKGIRASLLQADYGIAETGSIVLISSDENINRASMLSDSITYILLENNIVDTLDSISKYIERETKKEKNYITIITGPSRTADIENQLIIGVHGPKEQRIIVVKKD